MSRIAIIGGGNIGEALLSGLLRSGRQVKDIAVAERVPSRMRYLSETYSVLVTNVADAVESADFVIVAVKPSDVDSVTDEIADAVARDKADRVEHVFVTVVAGVSTAYFESKLPAGAPVVRVMPNAPMVVGAGVSAIAKGRFATAGAAQRGCRGVRLGRRGADRAGVAARRGHSGLRFRAGVLLPDGRGAGRRGCRGRV